jgi:hypothetical protein
MSDEIVENLKKTSSWLRVLLTLGFFVALYVSAVVLFVIILAQLIFSLLTGADNQNLRRLGAGLVDYVGQILGFVTFNSAQRPFPFAPFPAVTPDTAEPEPVPEAEPVPAAEPEPEPAAPTLQESPAPAAKTTATKKPAARKPRIKKSDKTSKSEATDSSNDAISDRSEN